MQQLPLPLGKIDEIFEKKEYAISPEHRRFPMAIFGATGSGKTTLLQNMIQWDIDTGNGVLAADPHGDLVDALAERIPRTRIKDVIYFDRDRKKAGEIAEALQDQYDG